MTPDERIAELEREVARLREAGVCFDCRPTLESAKAEIARLVMEREHYQGGLAAALTEDVGELKAENARLQEQLALAISGSVAFAAPPAQPVAPLVFSGTPRARATFYYDWCGACLEGAHSRCVGGGCKCNRSPCAPAAEPVRAEPCSHGPVHCVCMNCGENISDVVAALRAEVARLTGKIHYAALLSSIGDMRRVLKDAIGESHTEPARVIQGDAALSPAPVAAKEEP